MCPCLPRVFPIFSRPDTVSRWNDKKPLWRGRVALQRTGQSKPRGDHICISVACSLVRAREGRYKWETLKRGCPMWLLPVSQPVISSCALLMSPSPQPHPSPQEVRAALLRWADRGASGLGWALVQSSQFFMAASGWCEDGSNSQNTGGSVCSGFSATSPPVKTKTKLPLPR